MAKEQYGSRKQMTAIECALNKRLIFDILRQTKKPAGICSCDLKSCYDRIVHSFASLAMQRAGAPKIAIDCMFETIQKLKHVVRTSFGESESSFGGEDWRILEQLQGIGQGNGAGPAIWAVISSVFFDMIRDKGLGLKLRAPLSKLALHMAGCGFVDDTDIIQSGLSTDDYWDVAERLQEALLWWENGSRASGGALVPKKSWYSLVDFVWTDGEWKYGTNMGDAEIKVMNAEGSREKLEILEVDEAKRMLGVFLAVDGNNKTQVEEMRKIADLWYEKVRVGHLTRYDAWMALNSTVMKTLEYPLLALTLTEEECKKIMAPILKGGLPKIGMCRTLPRKIVYGSLKNQGMGIHNLFTTQGILHIQTLLDHIWRDTETGKLIRTSIECAKMEVGILGSLFGHNFEDYGNLCEETWVKHLWKYTHDKGIRIEDKVGDFDKLRENDSCITLHFAGAYKAGLITKAEWVKANKCRKYLRVLTISDIASGNGKFIERNIQNGRRLYGRARTLDWAIQGKPKKTDWTVWRRVLKRSITNEIGKLHMPVGKWIEEAVEANLQNWVWYWDIQNKVLYKKIQNTWSKYRMDRKRTRGGNGGNKIRFKYYSSVPQPTDRSNLRMTTVNVEKGWIVTEGYTDAVKEDTHNDDILPNSDSLREAFRKRKGERWALNNIVMTEEIDEIIEDIIKGTAIGVSDGSFKDEFGTASWAIENESGTQRINGDGIIPGFPSDQSAYRSEIGGLYGLVLAVEIIKDLWKIRSGAIVLGCDGINALYQALDIKNVTISSKQQQFDLLSGIQGYIRDSIIKFIPIHIKGHQDDLKMIDELDRWAIINIEMDLRAKNCWHENSRTGRYVKYTVPKGMWKVSILGNRISNHFGEYVRESIEGEAIADYWINDKKRFTEEGYFQVDWDACKMAMRKSKVTRRHWVTKFESGWCATGKMMKKWNYRLVDNCPRCGAPGESTTHILKCRAASAEIQWGKSMMELSKWLEENNTCPDISKFLVQALDQWRSGEEVTRPKSPMFDGMRDIFYSQNTIGWRPFIGGCISYMWVRVQDQYLKWIDSRKSGKRWAIVLIQKLWDVAWDMWDDRNHTLHDTPMAMELSGGLSLNQAIRQELHIGIQSLPQRVQSVFPNDNDTILEASINVRKQWFVLVRATRENTHTFLYNDAFSTPYSKLRQWVGL